MNIIELTPFQQTILILGALLLSWLWIYVAGRLLSAGAIRSWWDFFSKNKRDRKGGQNKKEER